MSEFAEGTASVSDQTSARVRAVIPDEADRDTLLLGAAALAVAAAVGIAAQRRGQGDDSG